MAEACPECGGPLNWVYSQEGPDTLERVCTSCGRVVERVGESELQVPSQFRSKKQQGKMERTYQRKIRRLFRRERFAFRITIGKSHKLFNAKAPWFYKSLVDEDVLFTGTVDFPDRSFVFRRARLHTRNLLGMFFSAEFRKVFLAQEKPLSFNLFLRWSQTPEVVPPGSPGLYFVVKKDGTLADPIREQIVLTPEEFQELTRVFLYAILPIGVFRLKAEAKKQNLPLFEK